MYIHKYVHITDTPTKSFMFNHVAMFELPAKVTSSENFLIRKFFILKVIIKTGTIQPRKKDICGRGLSKLPVMQGAGSTGTGAGV